jgi:hypothetical protein
MKKTHDIVFERTPKGEDLFLIVKAIEHMGNLRSRWCINRWESRINDMEEEFKRRWHTSAYELIEKVFGK